MEERGEEKGERERERERADRIALIRGSRMAMTNCARRPSVRLSVQEEAT